jgi:electron transfer flavoprotein-quinone oxidoreductase
VVLVERGLFPGSKNVYGGVVYGRVLDALIPGWWEEVPVERWVVRRSTMMMTADQSLSVDFRSQAWGSAPYNGMTTYRADFDSWLAGKAVEAGAQLVTSTVATGLLRDPAGRVVGVRTDRPDGDLPAKLVVACDGVNSFLAKEAGLLPRAEADHHTLGVKEVLGLPAEVINERFGLQSHEGLDIEMVGCTRGIRGGGFLYTNADSVAVGVVLSLPDLAKSGVRPEEIITDLKAHPSIAPYLRGADVKEYAAHLIPEGGYDTMPKLAMDGMLIAGDAAAMTLAAGIWLEGVNFAIGSGYAAGRAADRAIAAGDVSELGLASYRADLEGQFVLADHKRLRRAPALVLSDRIQHRYPGVVCDLVESMFTVTNPTPKPGAVRLARRAAAHHGVKLWELASDTIRAARIFG